jgi:translation initiation factor 2-alpha kinase 4
VYALKRIPLLASSVRSRHLQKRIMREVKLLSRLNHENIVRYYSAWIEEVNAFNRPSTDESDLLLTTNSRLKMTGWRI